jgi:hypothetical protein
VIEAGVNAPTGLSGSSWEENAMDVVAVLLLVSLAVLVVVLTVVPPSSQMAKVARLVDGRALAWDPCRTGRQRGGRR